ncbi:Retrovirus-related Pol polyprotein from type-1 retrotransposable element R2 [Folsomia candida]|uniref:Retrovirus-related Pol polyprotein from type-1 retrotransposable element R2 n=1 Tax=Folsomia candida TaxID=158441 RepID=A0A226E1D5_FOLCA|nr:Retrovirus-related Pol polyprotein from type-1 retrotransposable element R2 [Folsomia candida]
MYTDASTHVVSSDGVTAPIQIRSGIHQGDPLSSILFNIAINPILERIHNSGDVNHQALSFADDLTPMDETYEGLQNKINIINYESQRLSIQLNPKKSPIEYLNDHESTQFLGKPTGFQLFKDNSSVESYIQTGQKILCSNLAPWQKIDAMKTFFYSSLTFPMRTAQLSKTQWEKVDKALRPLFKDTLKLPREVANEYLYGGRNSGSCAIPLAAEDSDLLLIDNAFKLLTSNDPTIKELALADLLNTTSKRTRPQTPTLEDAALYLSGYNEGSYRTTTNAISNVWTQARQASSRIKVSWTIDDDGPSLHHLDITLEPRHRQAIARTLRQQTRQVRDKRLHSLANQGKVMEVVAQSKASHHFIQNGDYIRFADWRFIHRARLNLVPLNGAKMWQRGNNQHFLFAINPLLFHFA